MLRVSLNSVLNIHWKDWCWSWNSNTLAIWCEELTPWKKSYDQPRQHIKKQRHSFANKGPSSQGYGFSSSHVWMWELDCEESWALKNWCFNCGVGDDSWVPWTARRSNQSILKEISSLVLIFLYSPALTSTHDYWKNHSFDKAEFCWPSNLSVF